MPQLQSWHSAVHDDSIHTNNKHMVSAVFGCVQMYAKPGLCAVFVTVYVQSGFVDLENVVQQLAESNMRQVLWSLSLD